MPIYLKSRVTLSLDVEFVADVDDILKREAIIEHVMTLIPTAEDIHVGEIISVDAMRVIDALSKMDKST